MRRRRGRAGRHARLAVVPDATGAVAAAAAPPVTGRGRHRSRWLRAGLLTSDVLATLAGANLAAVAAGLSQHATLALVAVAVVGWVMIAWGLGLYGGDDLRSWASGVSDFSRLLMTALILAWPLYAVVAAASTGGPADAAVAVALTAVVGSVLGRAGVRIALHRRPALQQRTLVIGSGEIAGELVSQLRNQTQFGLEPIGFLDDEPHRVRDDFVPYLGRLTDLPEVLRLHAIDRIVIAFSRSGHGELLQVIRTCREQRISVDIVPRLFEFLDGANGVAHVGGVPLLSLSVPRLSRTASIVKRGIDVIVAGGGLIALSPLLAAIAIAIKLQSPGPVLFRQVRMGRGGVPFDVFKFRSMYDGADARKRELEALNDIADGVMFKIQRDPRITPIGGFLRRYSLDELPQLINVLRGDMSLVGPRPLVLPEADALVDDWQARRLDLRPGLTGLWQVTGRSDLTVHDMVRFDYTYVSGWSLARDLEILLATVPAVFSGRGAY